ncbi:hypothetical protein AYO49_01650 [Verrucomicrobiaceae bacterium SCGC AG-212-N21]|nr:hypothetical protein AYO49_01650 [Verrucomicrobiaceae bacterium SCGC AG-212-N21]
MALTGFALHAGAQSVEPENAPEVAGFWGQVTGVVKSAQADGGGFVLAITKAEVDPERSTLKDGAPLLGKELRIGVRMPKNAAGVASQHPDDLAYIKTLTPGAVITVKVFAPRANPRVLRIQGPGAAAEPATKLQAGDKFAVVFPDLPPTFYRLDTEQKIPTQMTVFLPGNYDPTRKHPTP